MSAGDGYKYLLKSVAAGDGDRELATPLTRYYAQAGCPPGRWAGSGLRSLQPGRPRPGGLQSGILQSGGVRSGGLQSDGAQPGGPHSSGMQSGGLQPGGLRPGDMVTEAQLQALVGEGRNPLTGEQLGRAYQRGRGARERAAARAAALGRGMGDADRAAAVQRINDEERERGSRRAVAGYDFTFSVPKSVSVLWGVADAGLQELIVRAHHQAVGEVLGFMEREVVVTRVAGSTRDGPVAQAPVEGVLAAVFDHWDSRAGDPQLHTHCVLANRVRTVADGLWRAVDGRPVFAATVALSELYNAVLADQLSRVVGVGWEARDRGRDRSPAWEIQGVGEELVREFSSRSADIAEETARLAARYRADHGREPSRRTVIRLRQQATLATRQDKQLRSLADSTAEWRRRAAGILGADAALWARGVAGSGEPLALRADDIPLDVVEALGREVMGRVGEKRSTWTRWNLHAEATRQAMGWRFAS
ncbi:MAG: relaxase domain-containing protein, partial [Bifidobacteriaceae bacterium]|nr:relaxase domain-containing protein [Bifidobacteriaceae bacterium]